MELQLGGKIARVTGTSLDIGRAIGDEFALEGVHVALCARGKPWLEEVATTIQQQHGESHEVVALAAFLASKRAADINGTLIPGDGGAPRCM